MPEIYLASSATPKFDCIETIQLAKKYKFPGIQAYLNQEFNDKAYTLEFIKQLAISGLGLLIHLPDEPLGYHLDVLKKIANARSELTRALIHHLPATHIDNIAHVQIGWENSISRVHDQEHIIEAMEQGHAPNSYFVYDFGRSAQPGLSDFSWGKVLVDVKSNFKKLKKGDCLHVVDQKDRNKKFRDNPCPFGEGIWEPTLIFVKKFQGVVVLEYEDLDMAVASRVNITK